MSAICPLGHRDQKVVGLKCGHSMPGRNVVCQQRTIIEPIPVRCGCGRGIIVDGWCCFCGRNLDTHLALMERGTGEQDLPPSDLPKRVVRRRPGERIAAARELVARGRAMVRA